MKKTFLFRSVVMSALILVGCLTSTAQEADSSLQGVITSSSVPITTSNDAVNPWTVSDAEAQNGNRGKTYSSSSFYLSFTAQHKSELSFEWYKYRYYSGGLELQLWIDGAMVASTTNSSYTTQYFTLDAGEHIVAFRDTIGGDSYNAYSCVRNIQLLELLPLENVLTEGSLPLTFVNESAMPWQYKDGCIEHDNKGRRYNVGATFSSTFTVEKTSKLSFTFQVNNYTNSGSYNYENAHNFFVYINGEQISKYWNNTSDTYWCVGLEPGDYTVEWKDTVYGGYNQNYYTRIKDIELSSNWIEVDLASPGTLGYEVLYSGKANVLTDVEFLKINGALNASDWTDIKNMTKLVALDLSGAQITEIANNTFNNNTLLNSIVLPETVTSIGEHAFRGTSLRSINIPAAVTSIGQFAFSGTPIQKVTFAEGAQLEDIGNAAFYNCTRLKDFTMPGSVSTLGYAVFQECSGLSTLVLSDAVTTVSDYLCYNCSSLKSLHLPQNLVSINHRSFYNTASLTTLDLPATLSAIHCQAFYNSAIDSLRLPIAMEYLYSGAFQNCAKLKYVELPAYLATGNTGYYDYYYYASGSSITYSYETHYWGYNNNFNYCTALETVVMRAATPPVIVNDPFNSARAKSAVKLVVPSFSVVNYKLDTYWYQFGTIVEGDDVDYWKLTSPLMLTNNRRMQGKPDVDLYFGGQLTVGGSAPFPMGQFNMYVNESNPGRLLNTCESMTADAATTKFSVEANKWYFFTPLYDVALADVEVSNDASYVFRYYDAHNRAANGASGSWKNVDSDKLVGGQGYIFHCNTACEITFPADANGQKALFGTKDVTRTLNVNEAESTANRSWNYIGNPYPAYYDIYYMDFTAPITVWTGSTYQAYSIADDEFVLRPMQSFFVQKPDAVDQIIFHKEGRQLTTSIAHGGAAARMKAPASSSRSMFNLTITPAYSEAPAADQTRVVINGEASMGYEIERDAAKFMSFETGVPQLFTVDAEGNSYAINERPLDNGTVALAYYAGEEGFYTISTQRADGEVSLYDAELNKTIGLNSEGYTFQTEATNGVNSTRFVLTFGVDGGDTTTGVQDVVTEPRQAEQVYDLQGRKTTATQKGIYVKNGRKVVNK